MNTQADEIVERPGSDRATMQCAAAVRPETIGTSSNGVEQWENGAASTVGLRVTPSTFKLDETPEERDERIRRSLAILASLLATTKDETEEQRETWKLLKSALNDGRPSYAKLFADDE